MIQTFGILIILCLIQISKYFLICFSFSSRNLLVLSFRFVYMIYLCMCVFLTWSKLSIEGSFFLYEYPIITSLSLEITNSSN